jgi:lactate dehydrogenase-like 2-hydroxyacid dehydrogenase
VNADVLTALGPEGILVNVARGSVVDEGALIAALQDKSLGAAGLDVFATEPHVPEVLFTMDQVVLTPHIGSATVETRRAMGDLTVDNLVQYFSDGQVITPIPECSVLIN